MKKFRLSDLVALCSLEYRVFQKEKRRSGTHQLNTSYESRIEYVILEENLNDHITFNQIDELLEKMIKGVDASFILTCLSFFNFCLALV